MKTSIAPLALAWYDENARSLPWRAGSDPYRVWVSESMLQQTRVETVIPYFERWMQLFPTLHNLAAASEQDVLKAWEGLGYYSRARNLLRAAKMVVQDYDGKIPDSARILRTLPGVGRYTAAAIASIAFHQNEAALDGNIRRILARVFNVTLPISSSEGEKHLWQLAQESLPSQRAGDYNQALMDIGALICTPKSPDCPTCPLREICIARMLGVQEERPIRPAPVVVPHAVVTAAVIHREDLILIARRPTNGLLGGMWEYPGGKVEPGESLAQALEREITEELGVTVAVGPEIGVFKHAYTHLKVTLHAFTCRLISGEPKPLHASEIAWRRLPDIQNFPMGKIDRQITQHLIQLDH